MRIQGFIAFGLLSVFACFMADSRSLPLLLIPDPVILAQPTSPVKIKKFTTEPVQTESKDQAIGIGHGLFFRNEGVHLVAAVRFVILTFNAFNEPIGMHSAVYLRPLTTVLPQFNREDEGLEAAYWFQQTGDARTLVTAVVWVDAIRFADGRIWRAHRTPFLENIRKRGMKLPQDVFTVLSSLSSSSEPVTREFLGFRELEPSSPK